MYSSRYIFSLNTLFGCGASVCALFLLKVTISNFSSPCFTLSGLTDMVTSKAPLCLLSFIPLLVAVSFVFTASLLNILNATSSGGGKSSGRWVLKFFCSRYSVVSPYVFTTWLFSSTQSTRLSISVTSFPATASARLWLSLWILFSTKERFSFISII